MRPRKVVLYVSVSEQEQSVMRFMLETNRYRVLSAASEEQAVSIFINTIADLVLVDYEMGLESGNQVTAAMKELAPHVPIILLGDVAVIRGEGIAADCALPRGIRTCELLERIKVMSARKRGPRKGSPGAMRVAEAARLTRSRMAVMA
jgi:DNA-binding response OmpR family regulator